MRTLLCNMTLLIGELVPENDDCWGLLLMLIDIVNIVCRKRISSKTPNMLRICIQEYLETLSELFPNSCKPKHHLLIHYPMVMSYVGLLWHLSSMRDESKHQQCKTIARTSRNRTNVCRTIAIKHQLVLNYIY